MKLAQRSTLDFRFCNVKIQCSAGRTFSSALKKQRMPSLNVKSNVELECWASTTNVELLILLFLNSLARLSPFFNVTLNDVLVQLSSSTFTIFQCRAEYSASTTFQLGIRQFTMSRSMFCYNDIPGRHSTFCKVALNVVLVKHSSSTSAVFQYVALNVLLAQRSSWTFAVFNVTLNVLLAQHYSSTFIFISFLKVLLNVC